MTQNVTREPLSSLSNSAGTLSGPPLESVRGTLESMERSLVMVDKTSIFEPRGGYNKVPGKPISSIQQSWFKYLARPNLCTNLEYSFRQATRCCVRKMGNLLFPLEKARIVW